MYFIFEANAVVWLTLATPFFVLALGFCGLLIPDSWITDDVRAKIRAWESGGTAPPPLVPVVEAREEPLDSYKLPAVEKVVSDSTTEAADVPAVKAVKEDSGGASAAEVAKRAIAESRGYVPDLVDRFEGRTRVCAWCGATVKATDECCGIRPQAAVKSVTPPPKAVKKSGVMPAGKNAVHQRGQQQQKGSDTSAPSADVKVVDDGAKEQEKVGLPDGKVEGGTPAGKASGGQVPSSGTEKPGKGGNSGGPKFFSWFAPKKKPVPQS